MKYVKLGQTGLRVSPLSLGCMTYGASTWRDWVLDEEAALPFFGRAIEAGINFFDTADVYSLGQSEVVLGRALKHFGLPRERAVIATKVWNVMSSDCNDRGLSRKHIMQGVDASLRRLGTDYIDLYQIHMQDRDTPEEETLRALDDLVRDGKVLYLGCSNYTGVRLMDSLWLSRTLGLERFVSLQAQYSLCVRGIERELVPACQDKGLGILPWSPLAGGFLTGKHTRDGRAEGSRLARWGQWWGRYDNDRCWGALDVCRRIAAERGATPGQIALAWTAQKPCVTSVIFGARSLQQLDDNLDAWGTTLSPELLQAIDAIRWEMRDLAQ